MSKIEETYNMMPALIKQHAGLPDNYISLTTDQKRFIIEMFQIDREAVKLTLLETVEDMKELVNEL
mgnify:CR=1 FL=1|tara:strand:- start:346 stop:543 length:198 start_codon:yes stop_codon:yes gene_type:complete